MAVFYKLYQDNRRTSSNQGKWYARAVHTGTVDIDDLAEEMQANCTVKRADIVAVLSELVETMQKHLQMSHRVKLNRLGTFKIGMSTRPADTIEEFTAGPERQVGARPLPARDENREGQDPRPRPPHRLQSNRTAQKRHRRGTRRHGGNSVRGKVRK